MYCFVLFCFVLSCFVYLFDDYVQKIVTNDKETKVIIDNITLLSISFSLTYHKKTINKNNKKKVRERE